MEVDVDKFETVLVTGSLMKNTLTKSYIFYSGGYENVRISRMRIGFKDTDQVDKMINKLLEVRKKLQDER